LLIQNINFKKGAFMLKSVFWILAGLTLSFTAWGEEIKMELRHCRVCESHPWLITRPSGEKVAEEATAHSDTVVFKEKEVVIARLKGYDRNSSQDKVIEAAVKGRALFSVEQAYQPDGLLPKKIEERSFLVLENDSVLAKKEKRNVFPWELLTLSLSAILLGMAWIFVKKEEDEKLSCPGYWMMALAIPSCYLCGVSISGFFLRPAYGYQIFLSFTFVGVMLGLVTLIIHFMVLILSMGITEGLSKLFKNKFDMYSELGTTISTLLCLLLSLTILSLVLPMASEAKNLPSAIFVVFLPGLLAGLAGQYILDSILRKKTKNRP
jgi:hypothetical protein